VLITGKQCPVIGRIPKAKPVGDATAAIFVAKVFCKLASLTPPDTTNCNKTAFFSVLRLFFLLKSVL
jgi:hypothetical protein